MDVAFDEDFTSPMVLPNLPFCGALGLRDISVYSPLQEAEIETTHLSIPKKPTLKNHYSPFLTLKYQTLKNMKMKTSGRVHKQEACHNKIVKMIE